MSRLTIYGIPQSRAFRVLWCAKELGLDYDNVAIQPRASAMPESYRAVNPMMRVPAIDDRGFVMRESLAINLYLARKYGAGTLWPAAEELQARAIMWSFWAATETERPAIDVYFHRLRLPPAERDAAVADRAETALAAPFSVLDAQLRATGQVLGPDFTIADLNIASVIWLLTRAPFSWEPYPSVRGWLERALARPAAAAAIKLREG
jgi:glutathione S-transferase